MKKSILSFLFLILFAVNDRAIAEPSTYPNLPLCSDDGCTYPVFNSLKYKNALKGFAFRQCLQDYDISYSVTHADRDHFFKLIGTTYSDVYGVSDGRYKMHDFMDEINPLLVTIATDCYTVARKHGSKMPFIDYRKGANLGWFTNVRGEIMIRNCLANEGSYSPHQINRLIEFIYKGRSSISAYDKYLAKSKKKYDPSEQFALQKTCGSYEVLIDTLIGNGVIPR